MSSYPLGQSEADTITSRTGKSFLRSRMESEVKKWNVTADDIKISARNIKKSRDRLQRKQIIQLWMRIFSVLPSL